MYACAFKTNISLFNLENQTQQDLDDKGESERKKPVKLKSKGDEERKTLEKEIREKETKIKKLEEANAKLKLYEPIIDDLEKQLKSQLREKETERAQAAQREKYLKEAVFRPRECHCLIKIDSCLSKLNKQNSSVTFSYILNQLLLSIKDFPFIENSNIYFLSSVLPIFGRF